MRARGLLKRPPAHPRERIPPLTLALLVEVPLLVVGFYVWLIGVRRGLAMQDFAAMRSGAEAVLHGRSPYPPPTAGAIEAAKRLVYPPLVGYLFVPFALLPYGLAAGIYFAGLLAALPAALLVLGVRDWRCHGAVLLWYPLAASFNTGALSPLLALLLALVWRFRGRVRTVAALGALAIVCKLFLWPLPLWLAATRRWRAAFLTCAVSAAAFLLPFAGPGFSTLRAYLRVLHVLDGVYSPISFSGEVLFHALGAPHAVAWALVALLALVLVLAMPRMGDARAFTLAILVALLVSPIVWMHYFVLLVVPVALARPRFSRLWLLPAACWLSPYPESAGELRRLLVGSGVMLGVAAVALVRPTSTPVEAVRISGERRSGAVAPETG